MLEGLFTIENLIALVTLASLEIVLGIDNIVFVVVVTNKLPEAVRDMARRMGIGLAMITRIALLLVISAIMGLTAPLFTVFEHVVSGRDLVMLLGGLFLLAKATHEIHDKLEGPGIGESLVHTKSSYAGAIIQILLLDLVFSLDSVITAVGMAQHVGIMIAAIVIAVLVMLLFSGGCVRLRVQSSDRSDARLLLPASGGDIPGGRGAAQAYRPRLHLFCHGLFPVRGVPQSAHEEASAEDQGVAYRVTGHSRSHPGIVTVYTPDPAVQEGPFAPSGHFRRAQKRIRSAPAHVIPETGVVFPARHAFDHGDGASGPPAAIGAGHSVVGHHDEAAGPDDAPGFGQDGQGGGPRLFVQGEADGRAVDRAVPEREGGGVRPD